MPLVPPPAWVLAVVFVDWLADVLWFVVPLGLIVTVLCGIALNFASVLTVVFAVGAVVWLAVVLVLLPAVLLCATAAPLSAAQTAAAITLKDCFISISSLENTHEVLQVLCRSLMTLPCDDSGIYAVNAATYSERARG